MIAHRILCLALIITASSIPDTSFAAADSVPRYQLHVGQQLIFHCDRNEQRPGTDEPASQRHIDWKIDVVAQNADGSWHILDMIDMGGTVQMAKGGTIPYERVVEASECDLYPDGSTKGDHDPVINLDCVFPRLPGDSGQMATGWADRDPDLGRSTSFHTAPATQPATFAFTGDLSGGIQGVFQPGARLNYKFNLQIGTIDQIDITAGKSGSSYSEQGKFERTGNKTLDAATLKKLIDLADGYEKAREAGWDALLTNVQPEVAAAARAKLDKAADEFRKAMQYDAAPPPPARPNGLGSLGVLLGFTNHSSGDFTVSAMAPDAPTPKHILDSPAPDWTAKDLDAKSHSMKDYRGRVVLLDFGFRTCPWCIRETPDIIRLHDDFKNQPVTILGMDIDTDPADVKFVRDAMQIPYPMLLAADVAGAYPLEGCPTVVIVDKSGVMRNRFVGYDTTGYDQMKAAIQSLLNEKPPAK